jgi:4-hydroxythreonine-4-phosphate dehydrogenase
MADRLPTIGITMGDPCGVGPEIVARALADPQIASLARFVVFGYGELLSYEADRIEQRLDWHREHHEDFRAAEAPLTLLDFDELTAPAAGKPEPTRYGGQASFSFVEEAVTAAIDGRIDALVTAPISKKAWRLAGVRFPGHTELLAKRTGTRDFAMMFVSPLLKVALATIHVPLMAVRDLFTLGCVFNPIDLADRGLREWFGVAKPKIAVCGLNPHAGEDGQLGDEEGRVIEPAILMATEAGMDVHGPFPADTLFRRAAAGEFDCVVAMYHDQALIPVKLLSWRQAVNLTLGLPIVRTSPAHGTAFDIAGRGKADAESMKAAISVAVEVSARRAAAGAGTSAGRRRR